PDGGGLGVRRTALSAALHEVARAQGANVMPGTLVRSVTRQHDRVVVRTDDRELEAAILVGADGLHSRVRREAGLEGSPQPIRRFGMRRHVRVPPWSDDVEVHFTDGVEAYVTPCGPDRVGIAFLFEHGRVPPRVRFELLLACFPRLSQRLAGAEFESETRGLGSLWHQPRARVVDRLVLLGDAAGYIDALTGEGVSLALQGAEALATVLPDAMARGGDRLAFLPFERACDQLWRRYALLTRSMLALARRPMLRRAVVRGLARHPATFNRLVAAALG
ncbi:MAG: NAD(P)/FAD-dependent oxidoreductase, partial [Myxococcaceae bacterium]